MTFGRPIARPELTAALVVWGVWAAAVGGALLYVLLYGSDVPYRDEWQLVHAVTTRCPTSAAWLLAANNEHRIPLPKAVYCGLMALTGVDFRAGMVFSVLLFGGVAALLIVVAARVRGAPALADAFFPLLLLHWGHSESFLHSYQIAFTIPIALATILGALMAASGAPPGILGSSVAVLCALALPWSSVVGLAFALPAVVWLAWSAFARGPGGERSPFAARVLLLGGAVACAATMVFIVTGFPPTLAKTSEPATRLVIFANLVLNGLGPGTYPLRAFYLPVVVLLATTVLVSLVRGVARDGQDLRRASGLLLVLTASITLLVGIAYARSWMGPEAGWMNRYVSVACLLYVALFLLALVSPSGMAGRFQLALLLLVLSVLLLNYARGREVGRALEEQLRPVFIDARAGIPVARLAERHVERLMPWAPVKYMTRSLKLLKRARAGPYRFLRRPLPDSGTAH